MPLNAWAEARRQDGKRKGNYPLIRAIKRVISFELGSSLLPNRLLYIWQFPPGLINNERNSIYRIQSMEFQLIARDKTSLDIFWLKDKSLADLDNLPEPDVLAAEIIENLEAGLNSFREIAGALG